MPVTLGRGCGRGREQFPFQPGNLALEKVNDTLVIPFPEWFVDYVVLHFKTLYHAHRRRKIDGLGKSLLMISELSVEEIIAFSRVIAEEKRPGYAHTGDVRPDAKVSSAHLQGSDVLELTQVVDEDGSARPIASRTASEAVPPSSEPVATGVHPANAAARCDPQGPATSEPKLDPAQGRIVSTATSGAAAAAFAQLGTLPRDRRVERELPLRGAERTLEGIVREMLRPMLQSWLDEHLPGIVERLVREEIARVVGESGSNLRGDYPRISERLLEEFFRDVLCRQDTDVY